MSTEKTDLDSLVLQVGEVQTIPTANTVLDRLKQIQANSLPGASNFTALNSTNVNTINGNLFQIDTDVNNQNVYFELESEIIRPANATAYGINGIMNSGAVTTMPFFDFGPLPQLTANKICQIDELLIVDNNGGATLPTTQITFWVTPTLGALTFGDGTIFNPGYTDISGRMENVLPGILVKFFAGGNVNTIKTPLINLGLKCKIFSDDHLYFLINLVSAYTPVASEHFKVRIKGLFHGGN
jgi:hypothetical protein